MKKKYLVFDMDGTIADFYNVPNWLEYLMNEDTTPYEIAETLYDETILNTLLNILKDRGWIIIVNSWACKNGSRSYNARTRNAKKKWLEQHNFPYDFLHVVSYGKEKSEVTKKYGGYQILFYDNTDVRTTWANGESVDATHDILEILQYLIENGD